MRKAFESFLALKQVRSAQLNLVSNISENQVQLLMLQHRCDVSDVTCPSGHLAASQTDEVDTNRVLRLFICRRVFCSLKEREAAF